MPPKAKKNKKDKKKVKDEGDKLTAVDRTFYELTITDLNNKLARLRSHLAKLEDSNTDVNEKLRQLEEDRTDITAHLDRTLAQKTDNIKELNEHFAELEAVRAQEKLESDDKIKELEAKYNAMHEQLTSEVKLLNGKLNSLEEFRIQRDKMLTKFDNQEAQFREQELRHREVISEMEQKSILEKDQLKKDVENKLLQLSEDFTKSSEIRIAGYTRRLIRENIALNKEMEKMITSQQHMNAENVTLLEKSRAGLHDSEINQITEKRLIKTCQHQIAIIDDLTRKYEQLKNKQVNLLNYKTMYENLVKKDIVDKFTYTDVSRKLRIMNQRVEMVKGDKQKLISLLTQRDIECMKLQSVLRNIKMAIESAIRGDEEDCFNDKPFRDAQRKSLLAELMQLVTTFVEDDDLAIQPSVSTISSTKSIYRPGQAGFVPKSKAKLLELFKREAKKISAAELISPEFAQKKSDGKITPKPRLCDGENLYDVESGSRLVYSSSRETIEQPPPDDEKLEEDQDLGGSSSESLTPITSVASAKQIQPSTGKETQREDVLKPATEIRPATLTSIEGSEYGEYEEGLQELDDEEDEDSIQFHY